MKFENGIWCYSPYEPVAYTLHGSGPGSWVNGDIAAWNLVWLTYRDELEDYRLGKIGIVDLLKVMPAKDFGVVIASVAPELEEIVPGLRSTLVKPLPLFLHTMKTLDISMLQAVHLFGGEWRERVLSSAMQIWNQKNELDDMVPVVSNVKVETVGNVLHVRFGKK